MYKKMIFILVSILIFTCQEHHEQVNLYSGNSPCHRNNHSYVDSIQTSTRGLQYGIVTAHYLASKAAEQIMHQGGNAVDAYIASQFALAVVYPRAGNIGGGGFLLVSKDGVVDALNYREKAPIKSYRTMYQNERGNVIDSLSTYGHLASGVPGTVAGLYTAFVKYSALKNWKILLAPAIQLAKKGFQVTQLEANRLNKYREAFVKYNPENTTFIKPTAWECGDSLIQPELASTLERIAENGRDGFYIGTTAQLIQEEMSSHGGIITLEDLKEYEARWVEPTFFQYYGLNVYAMSPPSSGGIALGQILRILELYRIDTMRAQELNRYHLMVEAMRIAYEDRAKYLGDPQFFNVPEGKLLSDNYLLGRMKDFNFERARISNISTLKKMPLMKESFETTHTSIIDSNGMAVSGTTTINSNYGSKVIVNGAGFFLNNEMDDFSIKPGFPNQFGLIGSEANAIAPGKRMLSSMTPTIILDKKKEPFVIIGTPGGSTIITAIAENIVNLVNDHISISKSITIPRFHHQWIPDEILYEPNAFPKHIFRGLQDLGHSLREINSIALVKGIKVSEDSIYISGDLRSEDHSIGQ